MSNTKNKYMMVLQYICGQPTFHSKNTMRQFKVSNNFLTAGKEIGLFKQVGKSEYKWNLSRPPIMSDVHDIQVRVRSYTQTHRLKSKPTPQLTINSIKNPQLKARAQSIIDEAKQIVAERQQSIVQHHQPECDTSNSKMFLILAVGAVVGFMIATIIWK
jgi:hypothetical protein